MIVQSQLMLMGQGTAWFTVFDFDEEIDKGVELLNEEAPGWFNSIDLRGLDLSSSNKCVLGQLAMTDLRHQIHALSLEGGDAYNFYTAVQALNLGEAGSSDYGFNISGYLWPGNESEMRWMDESMGSDGFVTLLADLRTGAWEQLTLQWVERISKLRADAGTLIDS